MKKSIKVAAGVVLAGALCASAFAFAGCGNNKGEAYGLVHSAGYVGYSAVTVNGDKVTDLTLTEVCLPTQVTAPETVAEADKVTVEVVDHGSTVSKTYYKTIKIGETTFTYDATAKAYQTGSTTLNAWLQTEANCKTYYEAVTSNTVKVTVGGAEKTDIMTYTALSKEENGYWDVSTGVGLGWKANRDNTVNYVLENGVSGLLGLAKNDDKVWVDGNGISTGATWTDLNTVKEGSISYAQLIVNAYNSVASTKYYIGSYHYPNTWNPDAAEYGVKVCVAVTGDKITKVEIVESDYVQATASWTDRQNYLDKEADLLKAYEGKTVAEVKGYTASISGVADATTNSVSESSVLITDATQSSARILLAVQDALKNA
ncbi:MAG: hypothetical protein ACI4L9_04210 [Candidatus Coproplasma sp.]